MAKNPTEWKAVSHYESTRNPEYAARPFVCTYGRPYTVRSTEQQVDNGRILSKTVYKEVNPVDLFKDIDARDFAIENIVASGATDMLRPCPLLHGDALSMADSGEVAASALESAMNNAENNED